MFTQKVHNLKQLRKNADIQLQDMSYLLETDISNLSKYERGLLTPTLSVLIGYAILTNTPISKLFKQQFVFILSLVPPRLTTLIADLEDEVSTPKLKARVHSLNNILHNLSCLQDITEKDDGEA